MSGTWAMAADKCLEKIFREIRREYGYDADDQTLRRILIEHYPFYERKYWPYKAWLRRRRAWIAQYRRGLDGTPDANPRKARKRSVELRDRDTLDMFSMGGTDGSQDRNATQNEKGDGRVQTWEASIGVGQEGAIA